MRLVTKNDSYSWRFGWSNTIEKYHDGYWSGDRVVIVGDESGNNFFDLGNEYDLDSYILLDDLVKSEFRNIGVDLFIAFIKDLHFKEFIIDQLKFDQYYYAKVAHLIYQCDNKAKPIKALLIENFGANWEKRAKVIWEDYKSKFI